MKNDLSNYTHYTSLIVKPERDEHTAISIDWLCWYCYFLRNSLKSLKTFCSEFKTQKPETFLFLSQKSI